MHVVTYCFLFRWSRTKSRDEGVLLLRKFFREELCVVSGSIGAERVVGILGGGGAW